MSIAKQDSVSYSVIVYHTFEVVEVKNVTKAFVYMTSFTASLYFVNKNIVEEILS